ncbi:MAG: hypothetical protein R3307_01090 [Anaerolineales bacterium]|nr:hypothetical protein [Anaerolineales bacterium]
MSTQDPQEKFKKAREASLEFLPILKEKLIASDGTLHTGTMLSASAWLTGTSLHRSFGLKEGGPPGTTIESADVNREWESLMYMFEQYNFQEADIPVGQFIMATLSAPESLKPKVEMTYVQEQLQDQYNTIMNKHGFDYLDGARAGVVLCSIFFQQYCIANKIMDPNVAAGFVAQGILEAAKTVPPPAGPTT